MDVAAEKSRNLQNRDDWLVCGHGDAGTERGDLRDAIHPLNSLRRPGDGLNSYNEGIAG